ncbi:sensor histidine kinase [Methanobacterium oryzae]|uniref:sensor histidine kinase n=1 Tax=Methanobacterium oryzae TaxID=69540 RepID=UPI003D1906EF
MEKKDELREKAEKMLIEGEDVSPNFPEDAKWLINELRVYQTELELQNEELRNSQLELSELKDEYYDLFESAPTGYFILDNAGVIKDVNQAGVNILELEKGNIVSNSFLYFVKPEFIKTYAHYRKEAIETQKKQSFELELIKKDRNIINVFIEMSMRRKGFRIAIIDISVLKETEEMLKKTLEKLKSSNEELRQFSFITSHDLQEPLRIIASFTQLLEKRYKDKLDKDADDYINFIVNAAIRMKEMIKGLRNYSSIEGGKLKQVNANEALNMALSNLKNEIKENNAEITYDSLPTVIIDEDQLIQLFQSLLSNAIKFRKQEVPPKIHISGVEDEINNEYIFSVSDNGIGIEEQYTDKIFEVFKRLHTIEEYEGLGIGLAISKKIVEHNGGRIWVKSELGLGSTFYFTIPVEPVKTGGGGIRKI